MAVLDRIVTANAAAKLEKTAAKMLLKLADLSISISQIGELSGMIGRELQEHLQQQAEAHAKQMLVPQFPGEIAAPFPEAEIPAADQTQSAGSHPTLPRSRAKGRPERLVRTC